MGRGGAPFEPLLERDEPSAVLRDALAHARRGEGRLVLVRGEAGIGKTALVSRFCAEAQGARLLTGACEPLTTPSPLGPVVDIAAQLTSPPAALTSPEVPRIERFHAFLDVLSSPTSTTVVIVEDAHWSDEATLDLIRFAGRRLHGVRVLVLVTYRDDELEPDHPLRTVAGDVATASTTLVLDLQPLSREAVGSLAAGSDRGDTADVDALYRLTAGNPFFTTEALAEPGGAVPPTVRDAVLARAARLGLSRYPGAVTACGRRTSAEAGPARWTATRAGCRRLRARCSILTSPTGAGTRAIRGPIRGYVVDPDPVRADEQSSPLEETAMSTTEPEGPIRFAMTCPQCGESTAYPTQEIADDKLALHNAFVHTAGGCASRVHPGRIDRRG